MNRAQGMEERIIPSSCPNISLHFSPLFFFSFFSFCSLDSLDVSFRRAGVRSQHAPAHTQKRGRMCKH